MTPLFSRTPGLRRRLVAAAGALASTSVAIGAPASAAPIAAGAHSSAVRAQDSSSLPGMWWYDAMKIAQAHKQSTGEGVTIAVIDGPVDPTIPELRGQDVTPVRNYCGNEGETASPTATGQRAEHATSITALLVGNGHGTGPGGAGIKGIAPDASVRNYVVDEATGRQKEIRCSDIDSDVVLPWSYAHAIRDATDDGADVISLSYDVAGSVPQQNAIEHAQARGVVVVAGAGNDGGRVGFPANVPGVVAVGMLDKSATVHRASSHGIQMVVTAPGVGVAIGGYDAGTWSSEFVGWGTSYATPLVAGSLALVKAKHPEATNWQLIRHLAYRAGGDRKFDWSEYLGFGAVSVTRMLADDPTRWHDFNPFQELPPDSFIKYGDNELTGTKLQRRLNSPSETAPGNPTGSPGEKREGPADTGESGPAVPALATVGTALLLGLGVLGWRKGRGTNGNNPTGHNDKQ